MTQDPFYKQLSRVRLENLRVSFTAQGFYKPIGASVSIKLLGSKLIEPVMNYRITPNVDHTKVKVERLARVDSNPGTEYQPGPTAIYTMEEIKQHRQKYSEIRGWTNQRVPGWPTEKQWAAWALHKYMHRGENE